MPQTNLGRVAFKFQGDYSALTTYAKYDVVFDGESSFVSQIDGNLGNELIDGLNWKYLAKGNNLGLQGLQQDVTDLETALDLKADLIDGKVPVGQLPSYVDDVLECTNFAAFPVTGESGKIYVALDTNLTYRWGGSAYTEISKSLALGETSTTAYRGDRGKTAYDHSQLTGNAHGTTAEQIPNTPAGTIAATTVQAAINELDSDRVQLETNLNKTDIKNAEQDASIKSIEQLLSQSNMNQTAQVSSSGREIVSLPKTASNGGMDIKLEGSTAQNLVANGDFRNGTTGWAKYPSSTSLTIENQALKVVSTTDGYAQVYTYIPTIIGNKYYTRFKYVAGNVVPNLVSVDGIYTATLTSMQIKISGGALAGDYYYVKSVISIDLTTTFGAGNEPDLATCDAMFSRYFEGAKSFIATGRVKTVGKNLLNKDKYKLSNCTIKIIDNGFILTATGPTGYAMFPVKLDNKKDYRMSCSSTRTGATGGGMYAVTYGNIVTSGAANELNMVNFNVISSIYSGDIAYVRCYANNNGNAGDSATFTFVQVEIGTIKTSYEPYKSTKLYLTAPDLRANGLVKDEVRKGSNGYEYVKKVGRGVILELITNKSDRDFSSDTGFWTKGASAEIYGGALNINTSIMESTTALSGMTGTNGKLFLCSFEITSYTSGQISLRVGNLSNAPLKEAVGKYSTFVRASGDDKIYITCLSSLGGFVGTIDNVSVTYIDEKDGLSNNSYYTLYDNSNINYTLATPVIIPIEHAGILNSAESGTVYHEPVVADAGVYGTNLTVFNTTYPISNLEEIIVHTNVDTYLDASKAVIASDGLSFTHPDLRAGDLVLFAYFFNKEKVNGLITATYYDGRYVIADTANGKFYKWGVKSTNGVATINLTEV